jgi:hypothetical protein
MNERTIQSQSAASELSPPPAHATGWEAFEEALASALSVLDDEYLVVSAGTGNRFVQFHVDRVVGILAETASNAYLGPDHQLDEGQLAALLSLEWAAPTHAPDAPAPVLKGSPNHFRKFPSPYSCAEVARFAVATLTGPLHVERPAELGYKAFDEDGNKVTLPVLPIEPVPDSPARAKPPAKPRRRGEFDKLRARVLAAARSGTGLGSLAYGDDGTLQVPIGNRTGWIRPCEKPFYVRVHLHLLSDVDADEEMLGRMHEVNARLPVARVIYQAGSVFFGIDFPAAPFRPEHLAQAMAGLAALADDVLADVRGTGDEVGPKVVN